MLHLNGRAIEARADQWASVASNHYIAKPNSNRNKDFDAEMALALQPVLKLTTFKMFIYFKNDYFL